MMMYYFYHTIGVVSNKNPYIYLTCLYDCGYTRVEVPFLCRKWRFVLVCIIGGRWLVEGVSRVTVRPG